MSYSEKTIYDLNLHEIALIETNDLWTSVMRVPGGWIYRSYDKSNHIMGNVFVPFDNSFQGGNDGTT